MNPNPQVLDLLFKWIDERHKIWYRRFVLRQDPPFTEDPVLADGKFTNVFRELDRGSLYYNNIFIPRCANEDEILLNTIWYRFVNRVDTAEAIGHITYHKNSQKMIQEMDRVAQIMYDRYVNNLGTFTAAHFVSWLTHRRIKNKPGMKPHEKDHLVARWTQAILEFTHSLPVHSAKILSPEKDDPKKRMAAIMKSTFGIGRFLAYEIWTDLAFLGLIPWTSDEYPHVGIGSGRALEKMFPEESPSDEHLYWLRDEQEDFWSAHLPESRWNDSDALKLSLRDVEHSLCEIFKYDRSVIRGKNSKRFKAKDVESRTESYLELYEKSSPELKAKFASFNPL